jgi:hypothetical protein
LEVVVLDVDYLKGCSVYADCTGNVDREGHEPGCTTGNDGRCFISSATIDLYTHGNDGSGSVRCALVMDPAAVGSSCTDTGTGLRATLVHVGNVGGIVSALTTIKHSMVAMGVSDGTGGTVTTDAKADTVMKRALGGLDGCDLDGEDPVALVRTASGAELSRHAAHLAWASQMNSILVQSTTLLQSSSRRALLRGGATSGGAGVGSSDGARHSRGGFPDKRRLVSGGTSTGLPLQMHAAMAAVTNACASASSNSGGASGASGVGAGQLDLTSKETLVAILGDAYAEYAKSSAAEAIETPSVETLYLIAEAAAAVHQMAATQASAAASSGSFDSSEMSKVSHMAQAQLASAASSLVDGTIDNAAFSTMTDTTAMYSAADKAVRQANGEDVDEEEETSGEETSGDTAAVGVLESAGDSGGSSIIGPAVGGGVGGLLVLVMLWLKGKCKSGPKEHVPKGRLRKKEKTLEQQLDAVATATAGDSVGSEGGDDSGKEHQFQNASPAQNVVVPAANVSMGIEMDAGSEDEQALEIAMSERAPTDNAGIARRNWTARGGSAPPVPPTSPERKGRVRRASDIGGPPLEMTQEDGARAECVAALEVRVRRASEIGGPPLKMATGPLAMPSRQALLDFYKTHDPSKTPKCVDAIITKFGENPEGLVERLRAKYGEVPAVGGAGSAVTVALTADV